MESNTQERNDAHHEGLALVAAFEEAGGEVEIGPDLQKGYIKDATESEKPKGDGTILAELNPLEKIKILLTRHKTLTTNQLSNHTALAICKIYKLTRELEGDGFLIREFGEGRGFGRIVTFTIVEDLC